MKPKWRRADYPTDTADRVSGEVALNKLMSQWLTLTGTFAIKFVTCCQTAHVCCPSADGALPARVSEDPKPTDQLAARAAVLRLGGGRETAPEVD